MNSGKLLDDFDVIFAIVVAQIALEKIILALYARLTDPPSDLWCAYGFVDPLETPRLPKSGPTHWLRISMLGNLLFFLWDVWP